MKIDSLISFMNCMDWHGAIKLAAKFHDLGSEKVVIQRAKDAILLPHFYQQLGMNPDDLVDLGKAALIRRYGHRLK